MGVRSKMEHHIKRKSSTQKCWLEGGGHVSSQEGIYILTQKKQGPQKQVAVDFHQLYP